VLNAPDAKVKTSDLDVPRLKAEKPAE